MRRLRLKLLFVVIIVLGLMIRTALPARADYFISENRRTIYSPNGQQSQWWHIQAWDVVRQQVATYTVAT